MKIPSLGIFRKRVILISIPFLMGIIWFLTPELTFGYPVPPLPDDNLIANPWFRSNSDPSMAGLDDWTNILNEGKGWGISQKESNPSPDVVVSGVCGFRNVYCGTGTRWAAERWGTRNNEDVLYPNLDVYLYQIVSTDGTDRKLKFFTYFVNHKVDVAEITIYGSTTPNGPWAYVWKPLLLESDDTPPRQDRPGREGNPWYDTGDQSTIIGTGYPYYKVELHARYPGVVNDVGEVGVKITGIYFSTEPSDLPADLVQPSVTSLPGSPQSSPTEETQVVTPPGTPTQRVRPATSEPTRTQEPTPTSIAIEQTKAPTTIPSPTAALGSESSQTFSPFTYLVLGFIACGVLVLLIYGIRKII